MIEWTISLILLVCFILLIRIFRLIERSNSVITISRGSFELIRSLNIDDRSKEIALQGNSKRLFKLFLVLAFGGAAAVLIPVGLLWLGDAVGLISMESVIDTAFSTSFLIVSCVLAALFFIFHIGRRLIIGIRFLIGCFTVLLLIQASLKLQLLI